MIFFNLLPIYQQIYNMLPFCRNLFDYWFRVLRCSHHQRAMENAHGFFFRYETMLLFPNNYETCFHFYHIIIWHTTISSSQWRYALPSFPHMHFLKSVTYCHVAMLQCCCRMALSSHNSVSSPSSSRHVSPYTHQVLSHGRFPPSAMCLWGRNVSGHPSTLHPQGLRRSPRAETIAWHAEERPQITWGANT